MTEWEPATEAETAMRDALQAHEQELYFRILGRVEMLLPVSTDALSGREPVGWGTWTTDGRTHVLAFTSPEALYACLAEHGGTYRTLPFHDLAALWPNLEWWLAVNPGLPIEAYLPAWFVAQLSRGDVRLPGRTMGARARMEHATALRARATAQVPPRGGTPDRPATPRAADLAPPPLPHVPRPPQSVRQPVVIEGEAHEVEPAAVVPAPPVSALPLPDAAPVAEPAPRPWDRRPEWADRAQPQGNGRTATPTAPPSPERDESTIHIPVPSSVLPADDTRLVEPPWRVEPPQPAPVPPSAPTDLPESGEPLPTRGPAGARPTEPSAAGPLDVAPLAAGPLDVAALFDAADPFASAVEAPGVTAGPSVEATEAGEAELAPSEAEAADFTPANQVEEDLLDAAEAGSTDNFLSTLLLARVLVPGPAEHEDAVAAIDRWRIEEIDSAAYVVVFTSPEMLTAHLGAGVDAAWLRFTQLIRVWPADELSFAVNPGTPVGATLPGAQIMALASWAAEVGLTDSEPEPEKPPEPVPVRTSPPPRSAGPVVMQKTIPANQLSYYLERGYDRVSGFVHRASEVAHLKTPAEFYSALGLSYSGSPFKPDDDEVYVLRWTAYRADLYRIPYGGPTEAAMQAMQGWMIERPPFRGNGFAPSEGRDVIAEFKVDSVRLPHGGQLWRVSADGSEKLIAMFDADGPRWQRVAD